MVNSGHAKLSVVRQCSLLKIARSGLYYERTGESAINLALMQELWDPPQYPAYFWGQKFLPSLDLHHRHIQGKPSRENTFAGGIDKPSKSIY
jgi:hypothetical protein